MGREIRTRCVTITEHKYTALLCEKGKVIDKIDIWAESKEKAKDKALWVFDRPLCYIKIE